MKRMLNTLFITSEDAYLCLEGENAVVKLADGTKKGFPLHNLSGIISFSYKGASPAFMKACIDRNINLSFCTPRGKFLARVTGESSGNVLLRREQYRIADDEKRSMEYSKNFIFGKIYNSRYCIDRTRRDHRLRIDERLFREKSESLRLMLAKVVEAENLETLRGLEGSSATIYFDTFDDMILNNKEDFYFRNRNRKPPLDNVNAMLSFAYVLVAGDCANALEVAGLDSYVGFMHKDRPGRKSLSLDLMEELRTGLCDRFVLSLINNRMVGKDDFETRENGAVVMTQKGKSTFLKIWQQRKQDTLEHPFLKEKIMIGQIPYVQALLLARTVRGDLDKYPPFLWK